MICSNPECGKEFERKIYNQIYCSKDCNSKVGIEKLKLKRQSTVKKSIHYNCISCGVEFLAKRVDQQYCNSLCRAKKSRKRYYSRHKAKENERTNNYYKNNPDKFKYNPEKRKIYRDNNKEAVNSLKRKWANNNPEKLSSFKFPERARDRSNKRAKELTRGFIKSYLKDHGYPIIPDSLIELKRDHLKLYRTIKQLTR